MKEPSPCRSMRALLRRLGRSYTVEDIRSITHASDIFWRYIK